MRPPPLKELGERQSSDRVEQVRDHQPRDDYRAGRGSDQDAPTPPCESLRMTSA
jgi:hypothetical protein